MVGQLVVTALIHAISQHTNTCSRSEGKNTQHRAPINRSPQKWSFYVFLFGDTLGSPASDVKESFRKGNPQGEEKQRKNSAKTDIQHLGRVGQC